jgi:hypothetical protein
MLNACAVFLEKSRGKRSLGKPSHGWVNNMNIALTVRDIACEVTNQIIREASNIQ